jgi:hypothetical protein
MSLANGMGMEVAPPTQIHGRQFRVVDRKAGRQTRTVVQVSSTEGGAELWKQAHMD